MEMLLRYLLYFIGGGFLVVGTSYINEQGNGGLAGIVAAFPLFFLVTGLIAYYTSGPDTAYAYSRSMIISNVPWLAAVAVFAYAVQNQWNMAVASAATLSTYIVIAYALAGMVM
jgi:hypothetical protein